MVSVTKQNLNTCLLANDLHQLIKYPTRITEHSKTIIDLIFANMQDKVVQIDILNNSLSDHYIIIFVLKGGVQKLPPRNQDLLSIIINNRLLTS